MGVSPIQAPDKPTYVTIHFEQGVPTAIDGKEMGAVELVETLNKLGGENGIGLADLVEKLRAALFSIMLMRFWKLLQLTRKLQE